MEDVQTNLPNTGGQSAATPVKGIPKNDPPRPPLKRRIEDIEDAPAEETAAQGTQEEMTNELFLRFSQHARPFGLPTYPEIAMAGTKLFQQEGMVCYPIYLGAEIIYKFQLREKVKKLGHTLEFICGNSNLAVPLYAWESQQREGKTGRRERREGTLLTFRRAGQGAVGSLPAALFDKVIEELKLTLIVPTKMQRIKDTQIYNGNRFCVVETPENTNIVPQSIPLTDPTTKKIYHVHVNFKGQERYCSRCNDTHIQQCPQLKAFYDARRKREAMVENNEITGKIYSDSTLRHANALGLTSEICTMSGGGFGQIIQASLDDPDNIGKDTNVIIGGANDLKQQNFPENETFAKNIDMAITKLEEAAKSSPEKTIVVMNQSPVGEEEEALQSTDTVIRRRYLHSKIQEVATSVENIKWMETEYEVDETGHPSITGTYQILMQLREANLTKSRLIWNENFICSEKPYAGVESIYRYGCNGCHGYGAALSRSMHRNQLLCDNCYERTSEPVENELLTNITKSVVEEISPHSRMAFPDPKRICDEKATKDATVSMEVSS